MYPTEGQMLEQQTPTCGGSGAGTCKDKAGSWPCFLATAVEGSCARWWGDVPNKPPETCWKEAETPRPPVDDPAAALLAAAAAASECCF